MGQALLFLASFLVLLADVLPRLKVAPSLWSKMPASSFWSYNLSLLGPAKHKLNPGVESKWFWMASLGSRASSQNNQHSWAEGTLRVALNQLGPFCGCGQIQFFLNGMTLKLYSGKCIRVCCKKTLVQSSVSSLYSYMIFVNCFESTNFSFPFYFLIGDNNNSYLIESLLWRLNELIHGKCSTQCLAHSKCSDFLSPYVLSSCWTFAKATRHLLTKIPFGSLGRYH